MQLLLEEKKGGPMQGMDETLDSGSIMKTAWNVTNLKRSKADIS